MMAASGDAVRENGTTVLRLQLERNNEAPALARAAVVGFCQDRELSPSTIATLTLLTSEVVTNAVIHPEVAPPGHIGLHVRISHGTVRIEVSDAGSGFVPRPRDPDRLEGGYGLYLLDKAANRWGVQNDPNTTVWFELPTRPA